MTSRRFRTTTAAASAALLGLTLAACGSDDGGSDSGSGEGAGDSGDKGTITMGFIPSWTDGLSTAYLLEDQLGKLGYEVEMQTLTEAAPLYTALSQGDVDMYPSAWPEVTHKSYMDEYGDDIEDVGTYYDNAKLTFAVPEYSEITSIEDLPDFKDELDGKIIGIEPGAGLTKATKEQVIPQYGLDGDFELITSSTAGMLGELKKATGDEDEIVVTLWRPFWANSEFGMRDLEDPKGALGDSEGLHFLGTKGFAEEYPEAAELIKGIQLDDEQYGSLEDKVVNEFDEGKEAEAIDSWIEENGDAFDTLLTEEKK
ncbi:glycine betaine ABC transporter substrate-binding protein [Marihabitans asiaticum]|uniref:Glycine betaine/proline transport system substrate-binding protein n=1 Tax=Marihabitans asiaticum TaxID=415218 RepID=A0A560WDF0_9MICO|nr:glycine betaine ABC transporter substrate-binding protein [Marihabitans asiaticum]TWD15564.1 glycine betaine/proline transport system substrate-binding protein [Marihabitans asiaticum]